MERKTINGFSKLDKQEKIDWLVHRFGQEPEALSQRLKQFWYPDRELQGILDGFSENTLSNFPMPWGIAPNFIINGKPFAVPMVIEESSVVAAASSAAKFWQHRGGFQAEVVSTLKVGQLHFLWNGRPERLRAVMGPLRERLIEETTPLTSNMEKRGGGIEDMELLDFTREEPHYFQLRVTFETCDSMGANFINSVLEEFSQTLVQFLAEQQDFSEEERRVEPIMAILSNYTPECRVRAWVECPLESLNGACADMDGATFARKFQLAVRIAEIDAYRATTHNKGIFNGIDAVVLATGNDFRAVEAGGHTFACRDGRYRSLSHCELNDGQFRFSLEVPLALGTVGGLTRLHPLARLSLQLLGNPSAPELMQIIGATGLAQNFAAVRSLVTTGIQKGHMKMHLQNILHHLGADDHQKEAALHHFADRTVSFQAVREFLESPAARKV